MKSSITLFLCLALMGCHLKNPDVVDPEPTPDDPVVVDPVSFPASDAWGVLARHIETGILTDSDLLLQTVKRNERLGYLSSSDVEAFSSAFPDLIQKRRVLNDQDAEKLKSL